MRTVIDVAPTEQMENSTAVERGFLVPWLWSATAVTAIRLLHAADIGADLPYQLQAALNLVAGNGLTVYTETTDNLADPMTLATLTHWTAGYSFCAAALNALGAGPGTAVKILGAMATMFGWWGWARLAFAYMGEGWRRHIWWKRIAYCIAAATPLFFTLPWNGTDIFLWALLPWVLGLVTRPSAADDSAGMDAVAGALTGFALLMRYASLFLVAYTVLIIACQCRHRLTSLVRRVTAFAVGMGPFVATQIYVNYVLSSQPVEFPGGAVHPGVLTVVQRAWHGISDLTGASVLILFWVPGRILDALAKTVVSSSAPTVMTFQPVAAAAVVIVLLSPVLFAIAIRLRPVSKACHDLRLVVLGLFVALPAFLLAYEAVGEYDAALDARYYWPVLPLAVFAAYAVAAMRPSAQRIPDVLRLASRLYVGAFVLMLGANLVLVTFPGGSGSWRRGLLVGTRELRPWPSSRVTFESSPARRQVLEMMRARPDTVLETTRSDWFLVEPDLDHSRIHGIGCEHLRPTHVTGPARLLFLAPDLADRGWPLHEIYHFPGLGQVVRADCFEGLPLTLVRRFPDEALKLLEAEIPDGARVELKAVAAP